MCGSHFQKIMCKNQTTIEHSWHLKNSFSYFGSLVSVMHIKCCYACMKSAIEVKICELIYSPLIFEIGAKCVNPSVELK